MIVNGCFEGGGIKGLAYVGALRFLEERGFKFFKVSGTSVGAIFAALVVAGYKSNEIENIIDEIDHKLIIGKNRLRDSVSNLGIYNINGLEKKIHELLLKKGKTKFIDVKNGEDYLLKIVAAEMKTKRMVIIPDDLPKYGYDKDEFLISKAIAMSCSIPLIFNQYKMGNFNFVDGGVVNNFPIELVVDSNKTIIGFRLNSDNKSFFLKLRNKIFKINKSFNVNNINIIYLENLNIKASQFKKGMENRKILYQIGYQSAKKYFYNLIY